MRCGEGWNLKSCHLLSTVMLLAILSSKCHWLLASWHGDPGSLCSPLSCPKMLPIHTLSPPWAELLSSTAEPQFLSGFLSGTGDPESSQAFCLCMLACIRMIPSQKGKHLLFSSSKSRWEVHLFNGSCPQLIQFGK